MKIDKLYINDAIRIREEYIKNIEFINNKESLIKSIIDKMEILKSEISEIDNVDEEVYKSKLMELSTVIDKIGTDILPYHEAILNLDKEQQKLYTIIKDKYSNIKDEEIQQQIIPYVIELDKKLKKML